ncbi:MAG: endonuclease/exonuclease/phosphatase family protein [Oligoflexia bacterium]|nr:endonuclease/exonuclease/phosphatase family protein [Oligoflexia bacterium]MBF0364328.1 endonuclease/exonuclease/phosphatase family protein [Oligoflexia bacterium]
MHIKIITYNIHKGLNFNNRSFVLQEIRKAIRSLDADIVFLQEVIGSHSKHQERIKDWPLLTQFEYLADTVWTHHAYGKNAVYTAGHHGNAILSKYPFIWQENINISASRLDPRGLLHGIIQLPDNKKLHLICIHCGIFERWRKKQVQKLCSRIHSHIPFEDALIIGGDFNDWRNRVSLELKKQLNILEVFEEIHGEHCRSYPSFWPLLPLDRIYVRGVDIYEAHCFATAPWNRLSDHLALYAEVNI